MSEGHKAMPDEQTTRDLNRLFGDELKEIRDISLRLDAHIAAQAEKIAEIEGQLNFERAQLLEWYNVKTPRCVDTDAGRIYGSHEAVDYVWDVICKYRALNGVKS